MLPALIVFLVVVATVVGGYNVISRIPGARARRRLEERLREVGTGAEPAEGSLLAKQAEGPLPAVDRVIGATAAGSSLTRLIEQAGLSISPGTIVLASLVAGIISAIATFFITRLPVVMLITVPIAMAAPTLWLMQRRSGRLKKFEEQFPEALELTSRAIRAGHAFQSALGMVAEELTPPVSPEFKKVFDQQNFGLPLRDALDALAERVPLVDVKFFVTAVAIQRDTGGNLAEVLDNLAHVVRERFKIQRQVRVHTAHGRITGFVLLALPAFLAVALTALNPTHMKPLFEEHVGQMMIMGTIVMQLVGFVWIRRVIKIEV